MSWDGFIDPIAGFFGQDAESQAQQGGLKTGIDGNYKPTLADQFWGRANDGQDALDTQKNTALTKTYKKQIEGLGGVFTPGQSEGSYINQVGKLTTALNHSNYAESPAGKQQAAQLALQTSQIANQGKRLDNEMAIRLQEMAANRDSQAAQLEYQKMRDRRADQEYNERMERLDRKDRQAMLQNLSAGLASLGAAFAL